MYLTFIQGYYIVITFANLLLERMDLVAGPVCFGMAGKA